MPLFKPNLKCQLRRRIGTNVYAEEVLGDPVIVGCSIVNLKVFLEKSSVRADSSGSRGSAQEQIADGVLLFLPSAKVGIDDQILLNGWKLRVIGLEPRFSLAGVLDHYEATVTVWGKP